jgi:leucyl/phenylalanyl-tRNA---protein transferase
MSTSPTDLLLRLYRDGIFPMAHDGDDLDFDFYKPHQRCLIPIRDVHIPKRLRRTLLQTPYRVTLDTAFETVINSCALRTSKRNSTWINQPIKDLFIALHREGHAHSVECWTQEGDFAGGLYGLSIGAVFCGESMVSTHPDASKIALIHLCAWLDACGYTILDSQFINPHVTQFGAYEIAQSEYESLIKTEMNKPVRPLREVACDPDVIKKFLAR